MTGPEDRPLTLADCIAALENRQPGSYADCTQMVDDMLDVLVGDALDRQPCRAPALAWAEACRTIILALERAGRGRGHGDTDEEPLPRVPAGGGGGWA